MKLKTTVFFAFMALFAIQLNAQIKVGNNPGTINTNSLLELESTTKGFLAPRVALTSTSSASPLTAPVPEGMLVYSDGGSVADGFYFWNGTKWLSVTTSTQTRSNHVLVKSAADFPAAVGGVVTLASNTLYEVNGTILMSNKINLNEATIEGRDRLNDRIIYTGSSGALFTGNVGTLRTLVLASPSPALPTKLFDIDLGGSDTSLLLIQDCFMGSFSEVGILKNFGSPIFIENCNFYRNSNGLTFQDDYSVFTNNVNWNLDNSNYFEKYVGTFTMIHKVGGTIYPLSTSSAIGMHISGITSISQGATLKNTMFLGTGTYVSGTFSNSWEVEALGIPTEKDANATGNLYITTPSATVISFANWPYKVAGTTSATNLYRVTSPSNNRLTYTGLKAKTFQVIASLTAQFSSAVSNKFFTFYIAKNGSTLAQSKQKVKLISNTDQTSVTLSCTVSLSPNDYLELWVENNTDGTDITIQTLNLAIR